MRSKRLLKVIFSVIVVIALSATMLSVVLLRLKNTNDEKPVDNTVTEKVELPIETDPVEAPTHSSKLSEEQKEWLKDTAKQIGQEQVAQGLGSPKGRQQIQQDYIDSQLHRGNYTGNNQAEFNSNSDVPTYSINYILEHYKELDGKEVKTEGFYSFYSYLFEHSYQVQNDPAIGVDDGLTQSYIHTAYILGANKTGIQMVSHKVDINPSALTVGDKIAVTGICHTQESDDGTLGYVIIELESLEIIESKQSVG